MSLDICHKAYAGATKACGTTSGPTLKKLTGVPNDFAKFMISLGIQKNGDKYTFKKDDDLYRELKPVIITFHFEAVDNHRDVIDFIKSCGIKVGMSIKPNTKVSEIVDLLPYLDLVLVMSVEPGKGGQEFIYDSPVKINELDKIRKEKNYSYLIEVDGGVNDITSKLCINADILVVGSFITSSDDYEEQIQKIKKTLD